MNPQQAFNDFQAKWNGGRVDYDHVYQYQCVDLILQYLYEEFALQGGIRGNAIDYWDKTSSPILTKFQKLYTSDLKAGDIVILRLGTYGHIGIANGVQDGATFQMLDQNGHAGSGTGTGTDAIQIHSFNKAIIAGVLRPNSEAPAAVPSGPPFTVVETYSPAKLVKLNKDANLWGLNYTDFDYMVNHPVEVHLAGDVWEITNKVHHVNGYDYYRRADQVDGFNVLDCDDYTPPPIEVPVEPKPYVPPMAPVPLTKTEKYKLLTALPYYASQDDAKKTKDSLGSLPTGEYIVWEKSEDSVYYNLTSDNQKNQSKWINARYNKMPLSQPVVVAPKPVTVTLEPKPTPFEPTETANDVMASFKWFNAEHQPVEYKVVKSYIVKDQLHGGRDIPIRPGDKDLQIYGYFVKGGQYFLRPLTSKDEKGLYYMYGIPCNDVYSGLPYLEYEFDDRERLQYGWNLMINKSMKIIDGVYAWIKKKI